MSDNTSTPLKTIWFLVSRLMILSGMVLFFLPISTLVAAQIANLVYGIDIVKNPEVMNELNTNSNALSAVKLIQVIGTMGGMLIPAWIFPRAINQESARFLGLQTPIKITFIGYGILLMLLFIPFVSWLVEINARLQFPAFLSSLEAALKASEEAAAALTAAFVKSTTLQELMINMLVVAIVPAIAEELLFRGALQQFLVYCLKNTHVSIFVGAALFSAFHGQVYGFLPRWILGVLLGYLFACSGSVWPGIAAHFLNNAITLVVSHYALDQSNLTFLQEDYHFPAYIILLSVTISTVFVFYLYKKRKHFNLFNE